MTNREIRRLTPEDLPEYTDIYLNAYPANKSLSEECYTKYYHRHLQSMQDYQGVNFFGLFEDGRLIATMKLIDFDINLFGEMTKATGLMALGVHLLHKKKGAAKDMMEFFERYTVESGAILSMLLPFRVDFYRRFGYGYGTKLDEYRIPTVQLPDCKDTSNLRLVKEDELEQVLTCHSEFVKQYHGAVEKLEEEIREMASDDQTRRIGYFDDDGLKGYAAFTFESESAVNYALNRIEVSELVYRDGEVLRNLLGGLRRQADLAQNIVIRTGEADFYHLLDNPQDVSGNYIAYGFLQTNVSAMGNMYKIPDVRNFIDSTKHRRFPLEELKIAFRVNNEFKAIEERFSISFIPNENNQDSSWSYSEDVDQADVEIQCNLADLSSLLIGSADLAPLVRLGVVRISDEQATNRLDRLFHYNQRPFTNTDY